MPGDSRPSLDLLQQVATFLAVCRTASLATVDDAGHPHAANVQFAADAAFALTFVSSPDSAHARHLTQRPDAAVTIYAHDDRPARIHGLQMQGLCARLPDPHPHDDPLAGYRQKYPFVTEPPYDAALRRQAVYRFTPRWLRWIDNRVAFGHKTEWHAPTEP